MFVVYVIRVYKLELLDFLLMLEKKNNKEKLVNNGKISNYEYNKLVMN